jgi:aflatoxin B1 aldehyde reductase
VREVIKECEKQSVPKPQLYQGMYHAICRKLETELFPVLRENGIRYYAYRQADPHAHRSP